MRMLLVIIMASWCMNGFAGTTILDSLFAEGERCYLMDDYRQLLKCIDEYDEYLSEYIGQESGDKVKEYLAYSDKMKGAYCYGMATVDDYMAENSFIYYSSCLNTFISLNKNEQANIVIQELAQLFYKNKNYENAKSYLEKVVEYYQERENLGITQDEADHIQALSNLAMCEARLGNYDNAIKSIDGCIEWQRKNAPEQMYESLRRKGKILMLSKDNAVSSDKNSTARKCYEQYVNHLLKTTPKQLDAMTESQREQNWLATHQFLYDCVRLGNEAPDLIYDLALFSKGYLQTYKKNVQRNVTKWTDVKRVLNNNECAIEFVQYQGARDENRLAALVLKKNSVQPKFIDILDIDSLMDTDVQSQTSMSYLPDEDFEWMWSYSPVLKIRDVMESVSTDHKDILYNDRSIPKAIWKPQLLEAIGNATRILFSPDGFLYHYALEYVLPDTTKTAFRLSSTRVIVERRNPSAANRQPTKINNSILLFGGIDYNAPITSKSHDNDADAYRLLVDQVPEFKYLYGSKMEADSIMSVWKDANRAYNTNRNVSNVDTLFTGSVATDENLCQWSGKRYPVIHISTHGFFIGNIGMGTDIKPVLHDSSMSESGLLFSGAVTAINDRSFDASESDGILSAKELSRLNLQGVKLMVLSACQTGLGYITADGVYGLSRAMKQAGVESMIVSLWFANDYSTCYLMKNFYTILQQQKHKDVHSAFMQARKKLQTEAVSLAAFSKATLHILPTEYIFDNPQYVNNFILIDVF